MKPFDEQLYALKLQKVLIPRMHLDTEERRRKVLSHQREIGQGMPGALHKLVDSDIGLIRDYIPEVDRACRETWMSDGNPITAEFLRNVLVHRVFSFIAVREGDSRWNLELLAGRCGIGGTHLTPALHHLVHSMNQLKNELVNRYEIEAIESSKKQSRTHTVPRAPKPPSEVGGFGIAHSYTKRTQIPPNPPQNFPNDLWPKTCVILAEAVKKFPDRNQQLPELCKHYISEMTPLFYGAVKAGTMKGGAVLQEGLGGMQDLLRSLLVYNDDGPHSGFGGLSNGSYQIYEEARNSEEWRMLARTIADAQADHFDEGPDLRTSREEVKSSHVQNREDSVHHAATDRRALVKAYIEEVRSKTGKRITKKDIWSKAGYQNRTEFERWERQDSRHPNKSAHENFTRILREKPHLR